MKRKFVFLIFILMLGLFIIPNFKPKAAAYTGGYTVNINFGTGYLANEGIEFYNNSTKISSLNPYSNYEMKTIQALGWTNHSISNVTKLKLIGGDDMYSVSVDGTTEEFSWGSSYEYELTSDINLYLNVSEKSNNNTIETIPSGYSLTYVIDGVEETVSSLTTVPTLSTPTKDGFLFDGWYYEDTYETKVKEGDSLTVDTKIYAKFNQLYDINFVVKFNGVELRQIDPITDVTEIPGNLPNPDEDDYLTFYEFKGWYLDEAFTSGITEGIQLGRDITLYAKLEIISYTLSFVTNTDLITLDPVQITGESMMTIGSLPVLSNHRFDFLGWYYEEDFITQVQETDCLIEDTIIYAKLINKYLLNYETGLEEFDSYYIDSIYTDKIVIPTWTYDNFVCDAWFYDMERTIEVSADDLLTQDTTIYALISQKSYQIIFDTDGANNIDPIVSTNIFSEENQPIPYKEHYIFIGWFYDNESFHEPVIFNDILTHDTILYAKFDHVKYNITFDSNGGTSINSVQQSFFNLDNIIPSKIGYEFLGWYKDVDCINKINEFDEVTEDTTVYANWRLKVINNVQDSTNDFDINDFINDYSLYIIIIFGLLFIFKRRR